MSINTENSFDRFAYVDTITAKDRVYRGLWCLFYALFFRPTPTVFFHPWRCMLLRLFGAKIGRHCRISPSARIWAPWNLTCGDYVCFAEGVDCYCVTSITIGSKVTISQRTFLCTASHDISSLSRPLVVRPISIGDHVWICSEAFIGMGCQIAAGAIVGARAAIFNDVPAWTVVGGNPARSIRSRTLSKEAIAELQLDQAQKD